MAEAQSETPMKTKEIRSDDIELRPDGWERFERAVDAAVRVPARCRAHQDKGLMSIGVSLQEEFPPWQAPEVMTILLACGPRHSGGLQKITPSHPVSERTRCWPS